jgi:hypothetical protein
MTWDEAYRLAKESIQHSRGMVDLLMKEGWIKPIPENMIQEAFDWACSQSK